MNFGGGTAELGISFEKGKSEVGLFYDARRSLSIPLARNRAPSINIGLTPGFNQTLTSGDLICRRLPRGSSLATAPSCSAETLAAHHRCLLRLSFRLIPWCR